MLDGLDTSVGESDTLVILPAMAGGSSRAVSFGALAARTERSPSRSASAAPRERRDGDPRQRAADAHALRAGLEQLADRREPAVAERR